MTKIDSGSLRMEAKRVRDAELTAALRLRPSPDTPDYRDAMLAYDDAVHAAWQRYRATVIDIGDLAPQPVQEQAGPCPRCGEPLPHIGDTCLAVQEQGEGRTTCGCDWPGCTGACNAGEPVEGDVREQGVDHPEATCQRCGGPNVMPWHAPSPLWNAVLRDPATGHDRYDILCPVCFAALTEEAGIRVTWCFRPHSDELPADPKGRTWDPVRCLWAAQPAPDVAGLPSVEELARAIAFAADGHYENVGQADREFAGRIHAALAARSTEEDRT